MRVATVDGLVTLYYDGSKELWNQELYLEWVRECHLLRRRNRDWNQDLYMEWIRGGFQTMDLSVVCKKYIKERLSWQQIIIVEGVTEIPGCTFYGCLNIKKVIFADTVIRIQRCAFNQCFSLVFIKWSISLEHIGQSAFQQCNLSSVFIPPRCRQIGPRAFEGNVNLSILNIPQDAEIGHLIIYETVLAKTSPIRTGRNGSYNRTVDDDNVNQWLKHINNDNQFALHRACASFNPLKEVIHAIVQEKGFKAFRVENSAGITPSRYLQENPYTELTEKEIIHDYLMTMMGEVE